MSERQPKKSKVLQTEYVMREGMDYTNARVRTEWGTLWIRLGGFKASRDAYPDLIAEAEMQARAAKGLNGNAHSH